MRRATVLILTLFSLQFAHAQKYDPVSWAFEAKEKGEREYVLLFKAAIDPGWYIYSQSLDGDFGPIPTRVYFDPAEGISFSGKCREKGGREEGYDPIFDMQVIKFGHEAVLTQFVKIEKGVKEITGYVEYMTCNDETCLPPREIPFRIRF